MRYFTERLANDVNVSRDTPFVILVTKSDEIEMKMPPAASDLCDYVAGLGFPATKISAASFSRKPETFKSGTGVFSAIETVLSYQPSSNSAASESTTFEPGARTFRRFRG
jgi:hypothetical protein